MATELVKTASYSFLALIVAALSTASAGAATEGLGSSVIEFPSSFGSLNTDSKIALGSSLRIAAREGRLKEVSRLLEEGADVNATGEFGETALMYAARYNYPQVADALLAKGAEINARDSRDDTALEKAAKNCSFKVAAEIIPQGTDVNWPNIEGRTALITATEMGCSPMVKQLLKTRGIRLNERDNSGKTALDHALEESLIEVGGPYTDIAWLLRKAGASTFMYAMPTEQELKPEPKVEKKLP